MTKSILFWMWIIVVFGMIVSILTLLIHCLQKSKKKCSSQNETCSNSNDCCDNLYCSGDSGDTGYTCITCKPENFACDKQAQCCSGLHCNSNTCQKCESLIGGSCDQNTQCCEPLQCVQNKCVNCIPFGDECNEKNSCCGEFKCNSDHKCSNCTASSDEFCNTNENCCEGSCNQKKCDKTCSKTCTSGVSCCSGQYCDDSQNCVDCKILRDKCLLSTDCCEKNICFKGVCSVNEEFESMGAFLIVNDDRKQSVSVDVGKIKWVQGYTTWDSSTAIFWFWSSIKDNLYLGVEVMDTITNNGIRYYVENPNSGESITLLGNGYYPQNKNIRLNKDGTITNTTQTLFLTKDLIWSSSSSDNYTFTIVVPSVGTEIGGNCSNNDECALPYGSCTEGKCVACYDSGRLSCNTSFFNRCNQQHPNKFYWECVVSNKICGTPTTVCKDTQILSCDPISREWECLALPSDQCSALPPNGFACEPSSKFQPMCNVNTNNNWICQSICTAIPGVQCDATHVAICYPDETTGLYTWHCIPVSKDQCQYVPFSPNCSVQDNITFYDSGKNCIRKCPYDMTKNDLLNWWSYLGNPPDEVTDIPVV